MRRALVVLAAVVVIAGAIAASAIFNARNGGKIVESEIHCIDNEGCDRRVKEVKRNICSEEDTDGVKLTIVYESTRFSSEGDRPRGEIVENRRRTYTEDC
jgi:hypothetical protein